MSDRTANLLGVLGLSVAERLREATQGVSGHQGETPAALVVIGYGMGPSNERLRSALGLSHPGSVRLVDRLVADGLVERRRGEDRRSVALYLTQRGEEMRAQILAERLQAIGPFLSGLNADEAEMFADLIAKMLKAMDIPDAERCRLCRLCDDTVCVDCPIPADFRTRA